MLLASAFSSVVTLLQDTAFVAVLLIGVAGLFIIVAWAWGIALDKLTRMYDIHRFVVNAYRHRAEMRDYTQSIQSSLDKAKAELEEHDKLCSECQASAEKGDAWRERCDEGGRLDNRHSLADARRKNVHVCHVLSASKE